MKLFFDTNILLDIALRREPFLESSKAVFADGISNHQCLVSWHSISNLSYIIGKIESDAVALEFIKYLVSVCQIAPVQHQNIAAAFEFNNGDFEDAMQIASAVSSEADLIVTRDSGGFEKSPIPVTAPQG